MDNKKVVVLALHDELESAYPPLNIAIGAASTGAEVWLVFSRNGVNILDKDYIPIPSEGGGYLTNALSDFGAASISELLVIASEIGVRFAVVDTDAIERKICSTHPFEIVPIKCILNEVASADLFVHF